MRGKVQQPESILKRLFMYCLVRILSNQLSIYYHAKADQLVQPYTKPSNLLYIQSRDRSHKRALIKIYMPWGVIQTHSVTTAKSTLSPQ